MKRSRLLLLFLTGACLAIGTPASAADQGIGKLAKKVGLVWKTSDEKRQEMKERENVYEKTRAETGEQSGGRFTINSPKGGAIMGPESSFTFRRLLFTGDGAALDFDVQWGIFRFSFLPPPKGAKRVGIPTPTGTTQVAHGEVQIETPTGTIHLYGTDVYIQVEREGGATTVYVAEGAAVVTGSGHEVRVEEGQWTYMPPGQRPWPPAPVPPGAGPDGGGPASHMPDDWNLPGPRFLDLRLDLPQ